MNIELYFSKNNLLLPSADDQSVGPVKGLQQNIFFYRINGGTWYAPHMFQIFGVTVGAFL